MWTARIKYRFAICLFYLCICLIAILPEVSLQNESKHLQAARRQYWHFQLAQINATMCFSSPYRIYFANALVVNPQGTMVSSHVQGIYGIFV